MTLEFESYVYSNYAYRRGKLEKIKFWEFEILGLREMNPPRPYDIYVSFDIMII